MPACAGLLCVLSPISCACYWISRPPGSKPPSSSPTPTSRRKSARWIPGTCRWVVACAPHGHWPPSLPSSLKHPINQSINQLAMLLFQSFTPCSMSHSACSHQGAQPGKNLKIIRKLIQSKKLEDYLYTKCDAGSSPVWPPLTPVHETTPCAG